MKFNMLGNANRTGPVRLSDAYSSLVGGASQGVAASQKALYNAYNSLNSSKMPWYKISSTSNLYTIFRTLGSEDSCCFYMSGTTANSFTNGRITSTTKGILTRLGDLADFFCMVGDNGVSTIRANISSSSHTINSITAYSSVYSKMLHCPAHTWAANTSGHVLLSTELPSNCIVLSVSPVLYATNNNLWLTIASISNSQIDVLWHNTGGAAQTWQANAWGVLISYKVA